jgi:hypothetical protein
MKPPKFHVGQAVVCLRDSFQGIHPDEGVIRKGKTYIIKEPEWLGTGWYYQVEEGNDDAFPEVYFAPVEEMPAEAYAELLEVLEPVTA